jgi:hypothetical protein
VFLAKSADIVESAKVTREVGVQGVCKCMKRRHFVKAIEVTVEVSLKRCTRHPPVIYVNGSKAIWKQTVPCKRAGKRREKR